MNMKRMRGRSHRGGGGPQAPRTYSGSYPLNRNHVFDSSGPDFRVRGTAQQLFEKYLQAGRDATGAGDRVMAESYFQHAEHYFRILNAINQAQQNQPPHPQGHQPNNGQHQNGYQNNQYRRPPQDSFEGDERDDQAGYGEQPGPESRDVSRDTSRDTSRDIPINAAPDA